ncbi:hypothetical protein [Streptomyces sp. NPDC059631]|uniref:hypothetical protein n=1 Tax=unclassified Streptomyces TaxID=2593676 RepID=UPI0036B545CA
MPTHTADRHNSPRELFVSVAGLLLLGSSPTLLYSVLDWGVLFGGITWPHPIRTLATALNVATTVLQIAWLAWLLSTRTRSARPWHRALLVISISVIAGLVVRGLLQHPDGPHLHEEPVRSALLAWLCYELYRWHGIPLSAPAAASPRLVRWDTAWRMTAMVWLYMGTGAISTYGTVLALRWFGPDWLPVMRTDQLTALGVTSVPDLLTYGLVWTVVLEGTVIAATAILLSAARRPVWQIYSVIAVIEIMFHAYFGVPALFMGLYAVLCTNFYLRHHRLAPVLIAHALFDTIGLLVSGYPLLTKIPYLLALSVPLEMAERWLAVKSGRRAYYFRRPTLIIPVKWRTDRPQAGESIGA